MDETMAETAAAELVLDLPWGDPPNCVPASVEDHPSFAWSAGAPLRQIRTTVRVRRDPAGGFHLLAGDGVLHVDVASCPVRHTALPAEESDRRVVDFQCDAAGSCVLLEVVRPAAGSRSNRLMRLAAQGGVAWSRTGLVAPRELSFESLKGTFTRLIADGAGRVYLPAERHGPVAAEIDLASGDALRIVKLQAGTGAPMLDPGGRFHLTTLEASSGLRGLAVCEASGQSLHVLPGNRDLHGWLVHPIGVDGQGRTYLWRGGRVGRVEVDGRFEELGAFDNLVVRPSDRQVVSSWHERGSDHVDVVAGVDDRVRLPLGASSDDAWRLVHLDNRGRHHVFGGEGAGRGGRLLVFDRDGRLEREESDVQKLLAIESRIGEASSWVVLPEGGLLVPVMRPDGFAIAKVFYSAQERA